MKFKLIITVIALLIGGLTFFSACDQTPTSPLYTGNPDLPQFTDSVQFPPNAFQISFVFDTIHTDSFNYICKVMFDTNSVWNIELKEVQDYTVCFTTDTAFPRQNRIYEAMRGGFRGNIWYYFTANDYAWLYDRTNYVEFNRDTTADYSDAGLRRY